MASSYIRYRQIRVADQLNDQKTPAQIQTGGAPGGSVTQEDFQQNLLSQVKQIIWGGAVGDWYTDFASQDVPSLIEVEEDFLLDNEPNRRNNTYSNIRVGTQVTQETWVRTFNSSTLKTIAYTYSGTLVTKELRKVFAADGLTVIAQMTLNYTYTGPVVTGATITRDV